MCKVRNICGSFLLIQHFKDTTWKDEIWLSSRKDEDKYFIASIAYFENFSF